MLPTVVADGGSDGVVPRPVRQVKDGLNGMPQLPPLPPPPRCTYLVRGTRRCKRFAETADRDVCTEHSPEALARSRSIAVALAQQAQATADAGAAQIEGEEADDGEGAVKGGDAPVEGKKRKSRVSSSQRRMVNPLNVAEITPDVCSSILGHFEDMSLPFVIDLGSAKGDFLIELEQRWRETGMTLEVPCHPALAAGERESQTSLDNGGCASVSVKQVAFNAEHAEGGTATDERDVADVARSAGAATSPAQQPPQSPEPQHKDTLLLPTPPQPRDHAARGEVVPPCNYLGLELRDWCVQHAIKNVSGPAVGRVHFASLSVHNSLAVILSQARARRTHPHSEGGDTGGALHPEISTSRPDPVLRGVTILFPDPWAKTKTRKRRILQPHLAELVVAALEPCRGFFYTSTDCPFVAQDMEQVLEVHVARGELVRAVADKDNGPTGWLPTNPFGVPSERERVCGEFGRAAYRALYWRTEA